MSRRIFWEASIRPSSSENGLFSFSHHLVYKLFTRYAENTFKREGISLWTNHHVERVDKGKMFVKEQGEGSLSFPSYKSIPFKYRFQFLSASWFGVQDLLPIL
jgi:hypothetical protein